MLFIIIFIFFIAVSVPFCPSLCMFFLAARPIVYALFPHVLILHGASVPFFVRPYACFFLSSYIHILSSRVPVHPPCVHTLYHSFSYSSWHTSFLSVPCACFCIII